MIIDIYRANSQTDKVPVLKQARERLEVIRLLIRILFDTKQIGLKRMIAINENIEDISRQLAGWQKHSQM